MKYNKKYNRWVTTGGLVYRYNIKLDRLVLCSTHDNHGYTRVLCAPKGLSKLIHRIVWETFNGEIPDGMQIDHIDNNKMNNDISNLQLVSPQENSKLKYTRGYEPSEECRNKRSVAMKEVCSRKDWKTGTYFVRSEFGERFVACYGESAVPKNKRKEYRREQQYFRNHGYLKWEHEHGA